MSDWREQGQEAYLSKLCFVHSKYFIYRKGWDHDHCEYCGAKFCLDVECIESGYYAKKGYYWICPQCWNDFSNKHHLKLCETSD